jgi:hypothetical protein
MCRLLTGILLVAAGTTVVAAEPNAISKGDYRVALTANGIEASWRGTRFLCASHLNLNKPGWTGLWYDGRNLPGSATAKVTLAADRITVTDSAPEIAAAIVQEFRLDDGGLLASVTVTVGKEIPASPVEYAAAVLPADLFAGGRLRPRGLLGAGDWETLPAEKPTETGPGTHMLRTGVTGLDLTGGGVEVSVAPEQGQPFNLFDMRSRDYPVAERHYWVLYQWEARQGEFRVSTRFSARPEPAPTGKQEGNTMVITDAGKEVPVTGIVVAAGASPLELAAARELQAYLLKLGAGPVPLAEGGLPGAARAGTIYVGRCKVTQGREALDPDGDFAALGPDGFILRARGANVLAAGKNERGTTYAVYRLLERLGCRFYARELEVIPALSPVRIAGPFELKESAAFEWRAMSGTIAPMKCTLSPGEWEANVAGVDVPKLMAWPKGGFWHHTMGFLLPAKPLAATHPDYLAQLGVQRKVVEPAVQQFCLSNPALLKAMTEAVLAWIASDPDKLYYPVHYGDVAGFCECDTCKAMYAAQGSITDTVIWFDNQIAKVVAEKYPGKFVTILAYHSTRVAPKTIRPEPNLLIIFCAIVECQARPWSAPINLQRNVCRDLEDWARLHPLGAQGLMSFDYPTTYHYAGIAYPALYAYAENLRYYHKVGIRGAYVCGLGSWKHLEHLYSYVMPRLLWNPEQDLGPLIDEFCQAWYGPAATPMREYIEMLHRGAMESQSEGVMDCHAGPGQKFFRELYTPEFCARAYALFEQAEALAGDELICNRIAKEKWGMLVPDLFLHGSNRGEIVPAPSEEGYETHAATLEQYRKVAELLRINRRFSRPWDVNRTQWNRYSLSALTGVDPDREPWWNSPSLQALMADPAAAFASTQNAERDRLRDFVTLENAALKVVLVPQIGRRIWRLYHKGRQQDLLWRGAIPSYALAKGLDAASYANVGGYEEYAGEKFGSPGWAERYQSQVAPDGRSVVLTATLPDGVKLIRTVTLAADRAELTLDSRLENASGKELKGAMLRVHPQFAAKASSRPELRSRSGAGAWSPVSCSAAETFLAGARRPAGAWAVRLPAAKLEVVNEFEPAQVGTCLFYSGVDFVNLELFSPKQDLAPGASLSLKHRYTVRDAE